MREQKAEKIIINNVSQVRKTAEIGGKKEKSCLDGLRFRKNPYL